MSGLRSDDSAALDVAFEAFVTPPAEPERNLVRTVVARILTDRLPATDPDREASTQPLPGPQVEPTQWMIRPTGIENTRFSDPENFYLHIKKATWHGAPVYVVTANNTAMGFTKHGRLVYLRHDVNAKHARHASFEDAVALATAIADGHLVSEEYLTWRQAEALRFRDAPPPSPPRVEDPS